MSTEADDEAARLVDEKTFTELWRVWRTINQMIKDRGYELSDEEVNITLDEFKSQFSTEDGKPDRTKLRLSARPSLSLLEKYRDAPTEEVPDPPDPKMGLLWVEFNGDFAVGTPEIRKFIHFLDQNKYTHGILVTKHPISAHGMKQLLSPPPELRSMTYESFLESDLLVNITHHELVPKHVLLSKVDKRALLERYRLKESQLPRIQRGDPMARYLGLRRGDVVKIIRRSETAGRYASYRWVV